MWVSRKEFDGLRDSLVFLWDSLERKRLDIERVVESVDTLTKQMKCSCENYEVQEKLGSYTIGVSWDGIPVKREKWFGEYEKVCLDCGWTTTYDTEEEALADKQELLDKQIDALKEQKKALK